jgi:ATP-dependent helicase HrpB
VTYPIDPLVPAIADHLRNHNCLVLEAPAGAGKTTRVPPALMDALGGTVLVLEPRRLAARLAARFVAGERRERVGETVGYQVRFEEVAGPKTRLRYLTEGVLTRRLLRDPNLDGITTVILDEFHERHLEGDLALALLRRLQTTGRRDLRIVVMSATLDAAPVMEYLSGARSIRSEGRAWPLDIEYRPHSPVPLEQQVAGALERLAEGGLDGHVLVFLPGAAEIRKAQSACAALAGRHSWIVLPLHGDQSPEEQDRAVGPSERLKIILATNVAESSITIEGVRAVVDSGLARVAGHSPWSGLPTLDVARISQASAEQRAGRAGRTGPGRAIRLYPLEDFLRRPPQQAPEVMRADLAPVVLLVDAMGLEWERLGWLDAPPTAAVERARELLARLGATGGTAREMVRYPLHPRLARLIVEARRRGVVEDGAAVAGLLSAGERLPARLGRPARASRSDVVELLDGEWQPRTAQAVRQIRRLAGTGRGPVGRDENALLECVLAAFPDRVAKRRQGDQLQMADGGSAHLAASSTVTEAEFLVAVEAESRAEQNLPLVRIASAIEPEWLLDLDSERVRERSRVEWSRTAERVEAVEELLYGEVALEERRTEPEPEAAADLLAEKALEAGLERFEDAEELARFQERLRFAAEQDGAGFAATLDWAEVLRQMAYGLKSFAQLEAATGDGGLVRAARERMPAASRRALDEIAPERIGLPGGRQTRVHYQAGQPPWIASRLQDFFGMTGTPAIARGRAPLVVRLLAPNQRPVQTTTDLAGFWERLYPQVRKELARRYPKHAWPEDPLAGKRGR